MRVHLLADTHGYLPDVPRGDLLVLAGDIIPLTRQLDDQRASYWLDTTFREWLTELKRPVIATWGNHDFIGQRHPAWVPELPWTLLVDCGAAVEVNGRTLRCYGSPWQPFFLDWAFNLDEAQLAEKWEKIPNGLDILVVHGPPYGILDKLPNGDHVGSASLLERLKIVQPKVTVFGHVHHGYGHAWGGLYGLRFFNAAYVNEQYRPGFHPIQSVEL